MVIKIPLSKKGKHTGKYETIIDDCDSDLAELSWFSEHPNKKRVNYAVRWDSNSRTRIRMHCVILERILGRELNPKETTDHIDGDGLNNQRSNLRLANHSQNMKNKKIPSHNTSGYKGASLNTARKKWIAQIIVNNKRIYLGSFDTALEAHLAYCKAAKELHGEFYNDGDGR